MRSASVRSAVSVREPWLYTPMDSKAFGGLLIVQVLRAGERELSNVEAGRGRYRVQTAARFSACG